MEFTLWFVIIGLMLVLMAMAASLLKRLPLTPSMFYLAIGFGLGPAGLGLIRLDPLNDVILLERLSEIVVIISLFAAGLKLRTPFDDRRWRIPVRLASASMIITVGLITAAGYWLVGLPLGAAVLLGAVLAPTDPVLASDVQVEHTRDRDRLRFGLTGEAGLNDGTAFPFVMLGLGLLGLHELGAGGWRWLAVDVGWAITGGLGIGWIAGTLVGRLVLYLRQRHREAIGLDDFLALGLIALAYGVALLCLTYGFLAVFAAGLALRRVEMHHSETEPDELLKTASMTSPADELATDPKQAPAYMAHAVLGFNEQLERIGEVGMMVLVGGLLASITYLPAALWFVPLLLLVIRPLAVLLGLLGAELGPLQRLLMSWFGIRGVGSIYYLMFAISHELPANLAEPLLSLTFASVVASVVLHGISVTPLMRLYQQAREGRAEELPLDASTARE